MFFNGMGFPSWGWGWGWAAAVGSIIVVGIFLIPWFFFLLNLSNLLERVDLRNRAMPPAHVWLNFIPIFNLGWFIYTVIKVRDSVKDEYAARGWGADGDFAYGVGMATGVLAIVGFFLGWIPFLGWLIPIAALICWILYWLKTFDLKGRLGQEGMWRPGGPQGYPGGPQGYSSGPFVPPVGPPSYQGQQAWPGGRPAPQQPPAQPGPPQAAPPQAAPPQASPQPPGTGSPETAAAPQEGLEAAEQPSAETGARTCAACGTRFDPSDAFCRTCGMKLP